jgi:anti-sigma regulatory factor (Ser/Thr protein kinase)
LIPPRTCTAQCWPEGSTWVVHVPELGRSARTSRLSQVEGVARELMSGSAWPEDPASCRVVVDLRVPQAVDELVGAAAALREEPDRVSVEAVTLRRCLARRLSDAGFDARDVAALLGLSFGRTLQLLSDHGPARRPTVLPSAGGGSSPDEHRSADAAVPKAHSSYRHEAFLYRGPDEFLAGTLPFVQEGVELGQPVMVAVVPERLAPLRAALPGDAPVLWVDMAELGANPARIIPAWRSFVDEHGGRDRPVRGVGEPVWAGRRPAEVVECQLHEALLNLAVDPDTPLWLRCPYDAEALDDEVLEEASRSHPVLVEGQDYRGSLLYGGVDHVATSFTAPLPAPREPRDDLPFDQDSVRSVRPLVLASAADAGVPAPRAADVALAVVEAATNSVRHGGGHGTLRVWEQDGALVCEVRDAGRIDDPLVGRRVPPLDAEGGRGLWLVNQLSDLVQVRSNDEGTAVRVHTWLEDGTRELGDVAEAPVASGR